MKISDGREFNEVKAEVAAKYGEITGSKIGQCLADDMSREGSYFGGSMEWSDRGYGYRLYIDISRRDGEVYISRISGSDISILGENKETVKSLVSALKIILGL